MRFIRHSLALAVLALGATAQAQISGDMVKIGVLTDMAGPYSGMGGAGSVVAAKMAMEDCLQAECKGMKIEVVSADHQNKADIAATKAREWLDRDKVDAAFFAENGWKSNLLINIGYGDETRLYGRLPRLPFDDACQLA